MSAAPAAAPPRGTSRPRHAAPWHRWLPRSPCQPCPCALVCKLQRRAVRARCGSPAALPDRSGALPRCPCPAGGGRPGSRCSTLSTASPTQPPRCDACVAGPARPPRSTRPWCAGLCFLAHRSVMPLTAWPSCSSFLQGTAVALGTYHTVALLSSGEGPAEYGLYTTGRGAPGTRAGGQGRPGPAAWLAEPQVPTVCGFASCAVWLLAATITWLAQRTELLTPPLPPPDHPLAACRLPRAAGAERLREPVAAAAGAGGGEGPASGALPGPARRHPAGSGQRGQQPHRLHFAEVGGGAWRGRLAWGLKGRPGGGGRRVCLGWVGEVWRGCTGPLGTCS